jgi:hypothetical protein
MATRGAMTPRCTTSTHPSRIARSSRGARDAVRACARARDDDVGRVKAALIRLCATTDGGKRATSSEREDLERLVGELAEIGAREGVNLARVNGKWSLLATLASAEDAKTRKNKEGAIGSALTEISGSSGRVIDDSTASMASTSSSIPKLIASKGNYQDIDIDAGVAENRAEFAVFGKVPLAVRLKASCAISPDGSARLDVAFDAVEVSLGGAGPLAMSLAFVNPRGWIETTYVDDDIRTGKGDKGSIFIAARRR